MKNMDNRSINFNKPILRWDEALPIGNGIIGGLIWGDGVPLKVSLDRGDLWDCRPAPQTLEPDFNFQTLVKLVQEGKWEEYIKPFMDCWVNPTPTKIPAGRLEINFGEKAEAVNSTLDIFAGEASVRLVFKEDHASVDSFLHAESKLGFLKIMGRTPQIEIISHDFTPPAEGEEVPGESRHLLGYPPGERFERDGVQVALQKTATEFTFAILTAAKPVAGGMEAVYYVACSSESEDWLERAVSLVKEGLGTGYDRNKASHKAWWDGFWSRSSINVPDKTLETGWYLANYMLACCSREGCPPMPLQGVWTADEETLPPWKGEYAANVNVQFCYKHYLAANHWTEGKVILDHLWNMRDAAGKHAKDFYDADGYYMPTSSSLDGQTVGGYPQCYQLGNQIWQALMFYDYYLYSGDEVFLAERAYPYLKGTAAVMERWFESYGDKYIFPISVSPEYNEGTHGAWLKPMSSYEISLCRSLYSALEEIAKRIAPKETAHWQEIASHLMEIPTSEEGILLAEGEALAFSHRHHSHLVGMYPFNLVQYHRSEAEKEIMENSITKLERMGTGIWNGFSFTWMSAFYARVGNGEGAAHQLHMFYDHMCSPNGFHLNGDFRNAGFTILHYRPFTLEANLQGADAIQEMLLQCHEEDIRLFPAIPENWKEEHVAFTNLCVQGGITVSAEWNGGVNFVEFSASIAREFSVVNPFAGAVCVKRSSCKGEVWSEDILQAKEGECLRFALKAGEKVQFCVVK